jgi:DNA-binding NarL/FixJ family response regulator
MKTKIRVCVVDDHPLFRDGVVFTLAAQGDMEIVGLGGSAADAMRMAGENAPDVIVLDMSMPGGGMAAVEQISQHFPDIRILMLTVVADEEQVCSALRLGARGYLLKGSSGTELAQTVRVLHDGEFYVTPALAAKLLSRFGSGAASTMVGKDRFSCLSAREEQILSNIVGGLSNKEIGNKLALSEKTIKHYVTSILQKLHVRNRVEAAILASDRMSQARPRVPSPEGRGVYA